MFWIPRTLIWLGSFYLVARAGLWAWVSVIPSNPMKGYAIAATFAILVLIGLLRVWKLPKDRPLIWHFVVLSVAMLIDSWAFQAYTESVMLKVDAQTEQRGGQAPPPTQ